MSGWVMTLLVGFLFFALAGLAVLLIWLWHEPQGQQRQPPQRQAPKIVIRPRLFKTKEILEQPRLPPPRPRPVPTTTRTSPPTPTPPRPPATWSTAPPPTPAGTTRPPVTRPTPTATQPPATRVTPAPAPQRTILRVTPTPPPAQQTVPQATPERVTTLTNEPPIVNPRFKVDFDAVHKRTGLMVRDCRCRECREMRADAGI